MELILTAVWVTVHTVKRKLQVEWRTVPRPLVLLPIMLVFTDNLCNQRAEDPRKCPDGGCYTATWLHSNMIPHAPSTSDGEWESQGMTCCCSLLDMAYYFFPWPRDGPNWMLCFGFSWYTAQKYLRKRESESVSFTLPPSFSAVSLNLCINILFNFGVQVMDPCPFENNLFNLLGLYFVVIG